jgi:two-component system, OmpR family, response regulator VicR
MPKVMVVDDEESLLEAIRYALSREGFEVVTATDGGEALRDFEAERPDLVVLDLMLPTTRLGRVPPDPGHQPGADPHAHRP